MVSKLTEAQWTEVAEMGRAGMRGKAIVDALGVDIHTSNINKFLQRQGIGQTGEVAELTLAETRREQMQNLFNNYNDKGPDVIKNLPDGARVVILSDAQIPFEEQWLIGGTRRKFGAIEKFVSDFKPHVLAINGDWFDAYNASRYDKSPSRRFGLNTELELTGNSLDTLTQAAPDAEKYYILGNHEERLMATLVQICQKDARAFELFQATGFDTLDFKSLMHLEDRGWNWQPYRSYLDILGFIVTHGDLVAQESAETAKKMFAKFHSSGTNGHTHRLGAYYHTDAQGKTHAWYESGCLCRLDLEYVAGANWQQGFLAGEVSNNKVHMHLVPTFDERFYFPGLGFYRGS